MGKILVIGSLNMDFVINTDKMPAPGETVLGNNFMMSPGGKGANQAYAIGKIGGDVSMIGAVGNDESGEILKNNLKSVNVNTNPIETIDNESTGCAFVTVDKSGENNIVVIQGTNKLVTIEMIDKNIELLRECDIVLMQLEIPVDTVKYVIKRAKEFGKTVILDPAPAQSEVLEEVFDKIDFAKPNETELSILTGMPTSTTEEIVLAARKLNQKGLKNVIVTLGKKGALLINEKECELFEVPDVKIVDTTAAGDSFLATFSISLAEGMSVHDSIRKANKVANFVCTRKGAQSSIPTREEINLL
ncbi:MAG: ribokinase [Clostridia bacterium]|nr:ribokinase [Clostridia bacterium]